MTKKPAWWPKNPYPEPHYIDGREQDIQSEGWDRASDEIWEALYHQGIDASIIELGHSITMAAIKKNEELKVDRLEGIDYIPSVPQKK